MTTGMDGAARQDGRSSTIDFAQWAGAALGRPAYPWQQALAAAAEPGQRLIRIPTGFGKTLGVVATWLYHRLVCADPAWPLRLVWMLPMRTLVEQTESECRTLLTRLDLLWDGVGPHDGRVGLHVLLGGADSGPFQLHPEQPAILVGTQDMLLSRALNRGYGAARARWPIDFGLLGQDTLWVLDEVQLMGVGFATALQLATFREAHPALRPSVTWAMSATLQRSWLQASPDTGPLLEKLHSQGLAPADELLPLWSDCVKTLERLAAPSLAAQAQLVLDGHAALETAQPLTLVVCNTVERARALHDELHKRLRGSPVALGLLHSRFRGAERRTWRELLSGAARPAAGQILVATQVIEAGVDLSADLLVTELAPWPSLVQRLGRLARRGGHGRAVVVGLDTAKQALPYDADELDAAWDALALLDDVSPRALAAFEQAHPELLPGLYPFEPAHLLLREELDELFDTTADLSGGDLDVSRFIREGEERDLTVAWVTLTRDERDRPVAPPPTLQPGREALCAVPFLAAQDWLCGRRSGKIVPRRLRPDVAAFVWDYLDGRWRLAERADLRPGAQVLVDVAVGGYDPQRGFDPARREPVPVVPLVELAAPERSDAAQDQEDLSHCAWQTIAFHGRAVAAELTRLLDRLAAAELVDLQPLLQLVARWHDLGKAHPAFRGAIVGGPHAARVDLAKAPEQAWRSGRCIYQCGAPPELRRGLRHELASLLGLFDVLTRWAPPAHPARLGELAGLLERQPEPTTSEAPADAKLPTAAVPGPLEAEVLALGREAFDLVAYLVCAHHGKLRARLHAAPADQQAALRHGSLPIRGIFDGDGLPPLALSAADGSLQALPASRLSLEPAVLGLSVLTGRSWTERVDGLRARFGPFALAYLEALVRAADVRASADRTLVDPALAGPRPSQPSAAPVAVEVQP